MDNGAYRGVHASAGYRTAGAEENAILHALLDEDLAELEGSGDQKKWFLNSACLRQLTTAMSLRTKQLVFTSNPLLPLQDQTDWQLYTMLKESGFTWNLCLAPSQRPKMLKIPVGYSNGPCK